MAALLLFPFLSVLPLLFKGYLWKAGKRRCYLGRLSAASVCHFSLACLLCCLKGWASGEARAGVEDTAAPDDDDGDDDATIS